MFACSDIYFRLHSLLIIITTTCISLCLRRTSEPIHLTSVLGVLGTQETFCIVIACLFERDSFDLFLPEFDKPWVIHLRETCCCSTNLCTWRLSTVYKDRNVRRHQGGRARSRSRLAPLEPLSSPRRRHGARPGKAGALPVAAGTPPPHASACAVRARCREETLRCDGRRPFIVRGGGWILGRWSWI
jgi:hypothetical protein